MFAYVLPFLASQNGAELDAPVSLELSLEGKTFREGLKGRATVGLGAGSLDGHHALAAWMNEADYGSPLVFEALEAEVEIAEGRVRPLGLELRADPFVLPFHGWTGVDGSLHYEGVLQCRHPLKEIAFRLSGTVVHPRFSVDN